MSESEKRKKSTGYKQNQSSLENNALLLAQAKALYNNGIQKFPKYISLRIDYSNFL